MAEAQEPMAARTRSKARARAAEEEDDEHFTDLEERFEEADEGAEEAPAPSKKKPTTTKGTGQGRGRPPKKRLPVMVPNLTPVQMKALREGGYSVTTDSPELSQDKQSEDETTGTEEVSSDEETFIPAALSRSASRMSRQSQASNIIYVRAAENDSKSQFRGGTYALIQDQLRSIDPFDGDTRKQSFDMFEYRMNSAVELYDDLPPKIKVGMLKQKLTGPPAEFLRLSSELQEYDYDRLMGWLRTQYAEFAQPSKEDRVWKPEDTPDSYYLKIKRGLEDDLPALPPKMIAKKKDDNPLEFERDEAGNVKLERNPAYDVALKEKKSYFESSNKRLIHDYLDGLKKEYLNKMTKIPKSFEQLHEQVREMWDFEQRHPVRNTNSKDMPAAGLPMFATEPTSNSSTPEKGKGREKGPMEAFEGRMQHHLNSLTNVNKNLVQSIAQLTQPGAVKPTARTGTAKDPSDPQVPGETKRKCYNCNKYEGHLARDCPLPNRKQAREQAEAKGDGNQGKGQQKGKGRGKPKPKQQKEEESDDGDDEEEEEKPKPKGKAKGKGKGKPGAQKPVNTSALICNLAGILDKLTSDDTRKGGSAEDDSKN
jgi:hypothetical protein